MRKLIVAVAAASCLATMAWADSNEPSAQIDGLVNGFSPASSKEPL